MDNQNPTENIPVQNPAVEETPPSQVYTAPQSSTPPPSPKSFLPNKIIFIIVILLILLGLSGTYLALNSKPKPGPVVSKATPTSIPTPTVDPTADWKVYTNTEAGYQISYPQNISIRESRLENVESVELGSYLPPAKIQHVALLIFSGDGKETMSISSAININNPNYGFDAKFMAGKIAETSAYPAKVAELQLDGVQAYSVKPEPVGQFSNWSNSTIFVNGKRPSSAYVIDVAVTSSKEEIVNQILSTFRFLQ